MEIRRSRHGILRVNPTLRVNGTLAQVVKKDLCNLHVVVESRVSHWLRLVVAIEIQGKPGCRVDLRRSCVGDSIAS